MPYDHSIPDDELPGVLQSLVDRGVLDCEGAVADAPFGLTRLGGELWEAERGPDWSRFVAWPYGGDSLPVDAVVIEAFDLELVETFLSVCENWFGWRDPTPQSTEPYRLVWMAEVFSIPEPKAWTVRCGEDGPGDLWDPSLQTWWSHPRELRLLRDRFP